MCGVTGGERWEIEMRERENAGFVVFKLFLPAPVAGHGGGLTEAFL